MVRCFHEPIDSPTQPGLAELLRHWERMRDGRRAPARRDLDPTELPPGLLPNLFILAVKDPIEASAFALAGTRVVEQYGREVTHRRLADLDFGPLRDPIIGAFRKAVERCQPVATRQIYLTEGTRRLLADERLLLPLSDDGVTVNRILGGQVACPVNATVGG